MTGASKSFLLRFALATTISVLGGCGNDGGNSTGGIGGAGDISYECSSDGAGVLQPKFCINDEDCSCGTGCNLGRCDAQCEGPSDCAEGQSCDDFGRCRGGDEPSTWDNPLSGGLSLSSPVVSFLDAEARPRLRVTLEGAAKKIRAVAPSGIEVQCEEDGPFDSECEVQASEGTTFSLGFRLENPTGPAMEAGTLRVFGGGQMKTATIAGIELTAPGESASSGNYRGVLIKEGSSDFSAIPLRAIVESRDGERVILVEDEHHIFLSSTVSVVLREQDGTWAAEASGGVRLAAEGSDPASAEVALGTDTEVILISPTLVRLRLSIRPLGILPATLLADQEPIFYELRLSRVAPRTADLVLALPQHNLLTVDPSVRTRTHLAWEALQQTVLSCPSEPIDPTHPSSSTQIIESGRCAQRILCADSDATSLDAVSEFGSVLALGGGRDVVCGQGESQRAFPIFSSESSPLEMLSACQEELRRFAEGPSDETSAELLAPGACMSSPRVVSALLLGLDSETAQGSAVGLHLLGGWLDVLRFVLEERRATQRMEPILGEEASISEGISVAETRRLVEAGLELLLHPRVASRLASLDNERLRVSDYRELFAGEGHLGRPLFLSLLETLVAYLDLSSSELQTQCSHEGWSEELDGNLSRASRLAFVLLDWAQILERRQSYRDTPDDIREAAEATRALAHSRLRTLDLSLTQCRQNQNPLGIDDTDLPLYFRDASTPRERFCAMSTYLLGDVPDSNAAWVPAAIAAAEESLSGARDAWLMEAQRSVNEQVEQSAQARREEAILRGYGDKLLALCGTHSGLSSDEILLSDDVSPSNCFLSPECQLDESEIQQRFSTTDMLEHLCVVGKLRRHAGPVTGFGDTDLDDLADEFASISERTQDDPQPGIVGKLRDWYQDVPPDLKLAAGVASPGGLLLTEALMHDAAPQSALSEYRSIEPAKAEELLHECRALAEAVGREIRPTLLPDSCEQADDCPVGFSCWDEQCQPEQEDPAADADCFHGSIGEEVLALRALGTEVDIAKSELAELSEQYDIAMRGCMIQELANETLEEETSAHAARMATLAETQRDTDKVIGFLGAVTAVAAAVATGGATAVASAGMAVASAAGASAAGDLDARTAQVQADHELAMDRIQRKADSEICFNDATKHLVGVRTATLRITQAAQKGVAGMVGLRTKQQSVAALVRDGRDELLAEEQRVSRSTLHQGLWIDERIFTYERKFRVAQRATYLAVRAAEYERQECSDLRRDVFAARLPEHLDTVVDALLTRNNDCAIGGKKPSDSVAVLSLRNDILPLADRSDFEGGSHALTTKQRLALLLTSPRSAAFDESGEYLGQRVVFSLSPEVFRGSASILGSGNSCAERLWSVTASVVGIDLVDADASSFVELGIEQQNSFYSSVCPKACASTQLGAVFSASVRPGRNLFVDPIAGALDGVGPAVFDDEKTFSSARVRAHFNVPRVDLEADDYADGESEELAGRALWSDYALLIPADVIQRNGGPGLRLANIDDVLVRLEYVSVAAR